MTNDPKWLADKVGGWEQLARMLYTLFLPPPPPSAAAQPKKKRGAKKKYDAKWLHGALIILGQNPKSSDKKEAIKKNLPKLYRGELVNNQRLAQEINPVKDHATKARIEATCRLRETQATKTVANRLAETKEKYFFALDGEHGPIGHAVLQSEGADHLEWRKVRQKPRKSSR